MREARVIVLNADYSYLNTITWKDAVCLLVKGIAKPVESFVDSVAVEIAKIVKTVSRDYIVPVVIRLVSLVRKKFRNKVPWNRYNIYLRDHFTCQYCGKHVDKDKTIDHVIPRSRGGKSTYENCVTACRKCNYKKNNRLPSESGMLLLKKPVQPTITEYINSRLEQQGVAEILRRLGLGA